MNVKDVSREPHGISIPLTRPLATLSPNGGEGVNSKFTLPRPIGGDGLGARGNIGQFMNNPG